ncbi:MAG TPA: AAA family ATPase [Bryobacteraceae bacterium]|jgi:Ti-type conjugative transfer relaxase TraA
MIAKGTPHNNGAKLAEYLTTGKDNERATLWQLRGFASDDIREAFRSVHVMAEATRSEQPFFHVQVRTPNGENLTCEQWERVADRIESKLGLTDQPRAIAFHFDEKSGHEHMHVAWSRIDDETMTARPLSFFKLRLKEVCRELENELGLTRVTNDRRGPAMSPHRDEYEQARRLGIDIHEIRTSIRNCWEHSDSGRSFAAALADQKLILARGERRAFIVIDSAGGMHALGKRILGHTAAEVRVRLADLDLQKLPSVEQVRTQLGCPTRAADLDKLTRAAAIDDRDPGALLESMTKQRATFTARDLDWTLVQRIESPLERAEFAAQILSRPEIISLVGEGPMPRYTTTTVLESEREVVRAAEELGRSSHHEMSIAGRASILKQAKYESISREQVRALRHATGAEGLALIDGQAGTGKSYVISAIREVYESQGRRVIGLAPTNAVAQNMKEEGFAQARTLHSELFALDNGRSQWDRNSVVMVDEAAMIDTRNLGRLTVHARDAGAKMILIGDDRQLASIERGGMFSVLKDRYGAAELIEVRRQRAAEDRRAAELMAKGNFRDALASHGERDGITWTANQSEAADALIKQWAKDHATDPARSRFVFAYTNHDVSELNGALRAMRAERGELGPSTRFETKHGPADFAKHDRIQFTGTDKRRGIYNGQVGTVQSIEGASVTVMLDGKRKRAVTFDAREFQDFRHGYAGTIYKGQGRTIDQTYLFHSEHWRAATSYVALTRHSHQTQLFVARDTAADMKELAAQMSRVDDRRAASHFREADRPVSRDPDQQRGAEEGIDWARYAVDRGYRNVIDAQPAAQHWPTQRDRGRGLERS